MREPKVMVDRQAHPAFRVLHDLYRAMGCPAVIDPVDPEDCAGVADESVRVLLQAGLLAVPGTWSLPPEPGPEVKAVRDAEGQTWTRGDPRPPNGETLWNTPGQVAHWAKLLGQRGPLSEVVDTDA